MSIALVVTRGFSNGTLTGTIADVATRGYTIGDAAPVTTGGGWLSPEQVRELRKTARKAQKALETGKKRRRQEASARIGELEAVYDRIHGLVADPEPLAAIVKPFAESSDMPTPPTLAVDWKALAQDMGAVSALAGALIETSKLRNEEEEALMLLMMA